MKVLIILNYQREIPPFIITEIKQAEKYFDHIEYITPCLYNNNSTEIKSEKVLITQIKDKISWRLILLSLLGIFRKEVFFDIKKALKEKKFNKDFLIHLATEIYPSELLFQNTKKIIISKYLDDQVCVLSSWFNCNAYATARLKKKYNEITAISYAHAFEVNPERGPFINVSLNDYKHNNLDRVIFISKNVLEKYLFALKYTNQNFLKNIYIHYLGTKNPDDLTNKYNSNEFNLLSCSSMSEVKRIELILDMLEKWNNGKIVWTHIGDGPLKKKIEKRSKIIEYKNPNVIINLLGKKSNKEVHQYYLKQPVDLFINVSKSEGLPVSIMEAISYGVPILATDVGGTSEIVTNKNGFLIKSDCNYQDILGILEEYKKLPIEMKNKMRMNSKQLWKEKFDADKNGTKMYESLMKLMLKNYELNRGRVSENCIH